MKRAILGAVLVCGCFGEPPTDKTNVTTVEPMEAGEESSSSTDAESSSSNGESSESSSTGVDPSECPEWCNGACDVILGVRAECRCRFDWECDAGELACDIQPMASYGWCR